MVLGGLELFQYHYEGAQNKRHNQAMRSSQVGTIVTDKHERSSTYHNPRPLGTTHILSREAEVRNF